MLRILGTARTMCDGLTRRDLLHAGGLGLFGLGFADLLRFQEARATPSASPRAGRFGQAKACILLYLYGAPSQLETFDLKPDAPSDVRGQFNPIATAVPGISICEHLSLTAKVMDRVTLMRSLTHPYNIHSAAYTLTGIPTTDIPMELNPRDGRHWPCFGSVLDYLDAKKHGKAREVPLNVGLPFKFSSRAEPFRRGGPYGGFLGGGYDPVWCEFQGDAPKGDPYRGITAKGRFQLNRDSVPDLTLDRMSRRASLLQQLDQQRAQLDASAARSFDRHQEMALNLVASPKMREALDIEREPAAVRERYGMTLFGQATLAARRLIESGVKLATVFWDEFKDANSAWDTHIHQWTRLKDELLPGFDLAFSALIRDLEMRGMLDETLILVLSEHGRTPKLNNAEGGGREHWSNVYCGLMAGGGIRRGHVFGSSDRIAGFPKEQPISPKDVLCTIYHLLGVDPETHLRDREGRPIPLVAEGKVASGVLA